MTIRATRRDAIKALLKAGGYATPVVVAINYPAHASAQVSGQPTPTVTPPTASVLFYVVPSSGPVGSRFIFGASRLEPNRGIDVRQVSGPGEAGFLNSIGVGQNGMTAFSIELIYFRQAPTRGVYVLGLAVPNTTNIIASVTFAVTDGVLPITPVLLVAPTIGTTETEFVFLAQGLIPNSRYSVLVTIAPTGFALGILRTGEDLANNTGQFVFAAPTTDPASTLIPGTYTFAVAPQGTTTILTQVSFTVVASTMGTRLGTGQSSRPTSTSGVPPTMRR